LLETLSPFSFSCLPLCRHHSVGHEHSDQHWPHPSWDWCYGLRLFLYRFKMHIANCLIAPVMASRALTGSIFSRTAFSAQLAGPSLSYSMIVFRFSRTSTLIFPSFWSTRLKARTITSHSRPYSGKRGHCYRPSRLSRGCFGEDNI